ncbi:hypothetical protein F2Q69_00047810 [Brassica cretica]|uniref:Uncharacterized protein n=1 Tax=Brassica cretica TaxID=69181 RepID=A0A8S9PM18_BRACR|nr:hypothetical protein F2Q69_00047810 [Brassica cretica]
MVNQAGSDGIKAESKDAAGRQKIMLEDMGQGRGSGIDNGAGGCSCSRSVTTLMEEARYEEAVLVEMEPSKKKKKRKREKTDIRKTKKMEEDDGDDRTRDERKAAASKKRKFDDGAQSSTSHATESKTSEADEGTNRPRVLKHLRHVVGQLTYAESFQFGHKTEQASCSCSDDGVKVAKDEKASALRRYCNLIKWGFDFRDREEEVELIMGLVVVLVLEEARYEEAVLVEMEPSKKKKKRKREKTYIRKTKKMEEDDGDDRTRDGRKAAA